MVPFYLHIYTKYIGKSVSSFLAAHIFLTGDFKVKVIMKYKLTDINKAINLVSAAYKNFVSKFENRV